MTLLDERLSSVASGTPYPRPAVARRASSAREKILAAADSLFYQQGIHAVGVDRILREAGVTRVTFYRHFFSKDELIEVYLRRRADRQRELVARAQSADAPDPRAVLEALAESLIEVGEADDYRGCEFVNAAAEYSDGTHPAQTVGGDQRTWLTRVATDALTRLGHPQPERLARKLLMLRSGGTVALEFDSRSDVADLFREAWHAILDPEIEPLRV